MAENDNRNCLPGNYSRNACKRLSLWSWAGLCFSGNTRAAADHQCPELPVPDPVHFQTLQGDSHTGGENCSESHKMTLRDEAPQAGTGSARKQTSQPLGRSLNLHFIEPRGVIGALLVMKAMSLWKRHLSMLCSAKQVLQGRARPG